jgi:GxxExxY protein
MTEEQLFERRTTHAIIGAFYEVYNRLGFGFLEHVYSLAMEQELLARGHSVQREVSFTVFYKGKALATHRLDMVIDQKVVVENKSTSILPSFAKRQTLSCLRASALQVGLLLHFGPTARFYRIVQTSRPSAQSDEGP